MQSFLIGAAIKLALIVVGTLIALFVFHRYLADFWELV